MGEPLTTSQDRHPVAYPAPARRVRPRPVAEAPRAETAPVIKRHREDIEGLRAVAVLLVMLSHAGLPFLRGGFVGVDVFFVISGFLITGRIRDEIMRTGRFSPKHFYAARVERLLPAATVTLYAVMVMMFVFLPKSRWRETAWDIMASGAYFVNWRLAERATDYFASSGPASAVQHFWSLAVEEQYYLLWPLVFVVVMVVSARLLHWHGRRVWRLLLHTLIVLTVASFAWSIIHTIISPRTAYFDATARFWELGLGSGLALVGTRLRMPPEPLRTAMAWAGIGAILACAVLFDATTGFPGWAAILPTVATLMLLVTGESDGTRRPLLFSWLETAPMQTVGMLSYSLYLWHWPLLVVFAANFGQLNVFAGLAVMALSFLPAYLSFRLVENPIRQRRWIRTSPWNALVVAAACMMLTIVPALVVAGSAPKSVAAPRVSLDQIRNGAVLLAADPRGDAKGEPVDSVQSIVPDPAVARADGGDVDQDGCFADPKESEARTCEYGDRNAKFKAVLVGDSHAIQWQPALRAIADARGWHLIVYGKSACPFLSTPVLSNHVSNHAYTECTEWNNTVRQRVNQLRPNLIITTSFRFSIMGPGTPLLGVENQRARITAMRTMWADLSQTVAPVVVMRDTPFAPHDVADCVSGNRDRLTKCAFDREPAIMGFGDDQKAAASGLKGVHVVDLNDAICPASRCAAVIGGVLIYRDRDHLTATYSTSLAPRLDTALQRILTPSPQS